MYYGNQSNDIQGPEKLRFDTEFPDKIEEHLVGESHATNITTLREIILLLASALFVIEKFVNFIFKEVVVFLGTIVFSVRLRNTLEKTSMRWRQEEEKQR